MAVKSPKVYINWGSVGVLQDTLGGYGLPLNQRSLQSSPTTSEIIPGSVSACLCVELCVILYAELLRVGPGVGSEA